MRGYNIIGESALDAVCSSLEGDAATWLIQKTKEVDDTSSKDVKYFADIVMEEQQFQNGPEFTIQELLDDGVEISSNIKAVRQLRNVAKDENFSDQIWVGLLAYMLPAEYKKQYRALAPKDFEQFAKWCERVLPSTLPKGKKHEDKKKSNKNEFKSGGRKRKAERECRHLNHSPENCYYLHPEKRPRFKKQQ